VLVEELQKIVRGQPPLSPAIARRLLTHFRQGGGDARTPDSSFAAHQRLPDQPQAVPIEKLPDHERLTPRESEVLTYLSKGFTIKEIASLMGIKWFTVNDHIKSIYKKLNVSSRGRGV
jgi:two-component system, NarL family, nitrate/nitrite response regulator NarL